MWLAAALGDIARARGMSQVAKDSGIAREALYKTLRPGSDPRFETIRRVCAALGVRPGRAAEARGALSSLRTTRALIRRGPSEGCNLLAKYTD